MKPSLEAKAWKLVAWSLDLGTPEVRSVDISVDIYISRLEELACREDEWIMSGS